VPLLSGRHARPELIDATAAVNFLGIERKSLYRLVARGEIPVMRFGSGPRPRLRFDPRTLAEHLNGGRDAARFPRIPPDRR
jgi:Helix-turn-helix domain